MSFKISISDIVKITQEWSDNISKKYKKKLSAEILINEETLYRVVFELKNCMVQVIVEQSEFAPYKNISFEVAGMKNNKSDYVYCWYDNGNESRNEIIFQLNKGIEFALNYN